MKYYHQLALSVLATVAILASIPAQAADNMASIGITPATGVVTLAPQWGIGSGLAGFHHMSQDLGLGGEANDFYSILSAAIPDGGNIAAFNLYVAASGFATAHVDIGSKLTPDSYSALTSADPDIGYGSVNMYFIHHKGSTDYFSVLVPGSSVSSSVTDLKPMSGPGGPSTVTGVSGYFGLAFASSNLGYGLNQFYYLRTDPVTGNTKFGSLVPALAGTATDQFDLGMGGHNALAYTNADVGFGTDKMYYLRLDPVTGFTILGTLHPVTGKASDIANLGSVFTTLTFTTTDLGFGVNQFYTTGTVNTTWQSVSFAAIADRDISAGSFTVNPTASSALPIVLTVVSGGATISAPVGGVFTVTPTAPGLITLQATQVGAINPTPYEYNMLRQTFRVTGPTVYHPDLNADGQSDILWRNNSTGEHSVWLMNGTTFASRVSWGSYGTDWAIVGSGDFNADSQSDILWRNNSTGEHSVWLMNGTTVASRVSWGSYGTDWAIVGSGDFNADGQSDILWRNNSTGEHSVWLMNGTTVASRVSWGSYGTDWAIVGSGDFNADGQSDILWRNNSTGEHSVWLMNGTTFASRVSWGSYGTDWVIVGSGDFNADGQSDILWRNSSTGEHSVWLMNGVTVASRVSWGSYGTDWAIVN